MNFSLGFVHGQFGYYYCIHCGRGFLHSTPTEQYYSLFEIWMTL